MTVETVVRFALAIVFDALAFIVWNVGTRPPLRLLRDVVAGARVPYSLARGLLRFSIGAVLLLLAAAVALPALRSVRAFTLIESGMIVAALLVEQLVGSDLRAVRRGPAG